MGPANEFIDAKRTRLKAKAKKNLQSFAHIEAFVKKILLFELICHYV